jgi:hypothetical protein
MERNDAIFADDALKKDEIAKHFMAIMNLP